jgi:hypothetical protein
MLFFAEGLRIDRSEPAHDRERGDLRLGRESALDGGQMRFQLRGHARTPMGVKASRRSTLLAHACERRSKNPSVKRPICSVAPE